MEVFCHWQHIAAHFSHGRVHTKHPLVPRQEDEVDAVTADPPHILRPHRGTEIGAAVLLLQTDAGEVNLQPLEDPQIVSGHSNPLLYIKKASQSLCLQTQNM